MNERKLNAWLEAGVGLAALAIGLGLVSVVSANWDAIPGQVRLGMHLSLPRI